MMKFALLGALLMLAAPAVAEAVPPLAAVEQGPGVLAVRAADAPAGPWRILAAEEPLPARGVVRSASGGPCRVRLRGASLQIGEDAELHFDLEDRSFELLRGRAALATQQADWTLVAGPLRATLAAESCAEAIAGMSEPAIAIAAGAMSVAADGAEPREVEGPARVSWLNNELAVQPLDEADQTRIAARAAQPPRPQGLGQLLIQDVQSQSPVRLNVARYHVHVVLQPPVALVQIDQSFYNPYLSQQEGQFVFNLPQGASVSRFAMYVTPTELIEGELIERQRAARIYQSIVDRQRDPAILEQIGDNLFKMRVFPVFARDEKRILLDYTLPLESLDGRYHFRLPLLSDLAPIWDFRISGAIRGAYQPESVQCFTHPELRVESRDDGSIALDYAQRNYQPQTDLVLAFDAASRVPTTPRATEGARETFAALPSPSLRSYREDDRAPRDAVTYFLVEVPPPGDMVQPPPVDVLVLADTSSNIRQFENVHRAVQRIVHHLRTEDRVRLVCADVSARPMHDGWLSPGDEGIAAALQRLQGEFTLGSMDLMTCLHDSIGAFGESGSRRRMVIYVGAGVDVARRRTADEPSEPSWPDWFQQSGAVFAGMFVERGLPDMGLRAKSRAAGGLWFDLADDVAAHRELFQWLLAGLPTPVRIAGVAVEGARDEDLFWPASWVPARPLYIYGWKRGEGPVKLTLTVGHGADTASHTWSLTGNDRSDDVFVGRLWAQRRLDQLRRQHADDDQHRRAIVSLSQEWSLLSPHTAFLVLESEADYARWKIDRLVRRRYWKPAEALDASPLPPDWLASVMPDDRPRVAHDEPPEARDDSPPVAPVAPREPHHRLLDPASLARAGLQPSLSALVGAAFRGGPDFEARFPHADALLREISVLSLADDCTLNELTRRLADLTGVHVMLDQRALEDSGIRADSPITGRRRLGGSGSAARLVPQPGVGRISVRSGMRHLLRPLDLVLVEEPHRLLITTREGAERRLTTEVYPVADLVFTDRAPSLWALNNPYLEREEWARRRLQSKLDRPWTADYRKAPLHQVVDELAVSLNDAVLLDRRALEDVRVSPDTPITIALRDVPVREGLRWILEQLELHWAICDEAVVITTPDESPLEVHLYSGREILYEYPGGMSPAAPSAFRGGMGGMGGGFFGGGASAVPRSPRASDSPSGMGGTAAMSRRMGDAGLSSGGDGAADVVEADRSEGEFASDGLTAAQGALRSVGERAYEVDSDSVIDMVTQSIEHSTWDWFGGPGSIGFFANSLDFAVRQTHDVHERLETLFDRLRAMPPQWGTAMGARPASVPLVSPDMSDPAHSEALLDLIDLVTAVVSPSEWFELGGRGTIEADPLRAALIVSQTGEAHEQVLRLLTLMRRSRYESLYGSRPWTSGWSGAAHGPMAAPLAAATPALGLSDLPAPRPASREALQVRRDGVAGSWTWERVVADVPEAGRGGARPALRAQLTVQRAGDQLQCELDSCTLRLDGDAAAVFWPSLRLVELGDYAETLRRELDTQLPWLPHRSNDEIARLFDVRPLAAEHASNDREIEPVWLRLVPHHLPHDGGTHLQIAYSRVDGLPVVWESYAAGTRTARIRFHRSGDGSPGWHTAILEDAQGQEKIQWRLITSSTDAVIPDLLARRDDYLVLDTRAAGPAVEARLADALEAMRRFDWAGAAARLNDLPGDRADYPLVRLLDAWCMENDPRIAPRERLLEQLFLAARSDVREIHEFAYGNFPSLQKEERYALLLLQPEATRTAGDHDRLAQAAVDLRRRDEALEHIQSALSSGTDDGRQAARQRLQVTLLLELDRPREARAAADAWVAQQRPDVWSLADMAELLASHGQREAAEQLAGTALAREGLADADRYAVLRRFAQWRQGAARWRTLLEAAQLQTAGSEQRGDCLQRLRRELLTPAHAEIAGWLAAETDDADLRAAMMIRQAELTRDEPLASELAWQVYQSGHLDDARLAWAARLWNRAGSAGRVIEVCERLLRSNRRLPSGVAEQLAAAYRAAGRPADALRAATDPPPATAEPSVSPSPGGTF